MTDYPTAAEARDDAVVCVDGPVSPVLPPAIARAQWAAVREALMGMSCACIAGCRACLRDDPTPHTEERYMATVCDRCRLLAEAERHLGRGVV